MGRVVTLVLVDPAGQVLGRLPEFELELPWWQEAGDVVAGARDVHGVEVTVLRLLGADRPAPPGGHVTYLAEVAGDPGPLLPATADLVPHPRRAPWARPGGPRATLDWAEAELAALGRPVTAAVQQRSWNLSTLWRLETTAGPVWLKQVPGFFAHEAAVLRWLGEHAPGTAPVPLAADGGRVLLEELPGTDRYGAEADEREQMLARLHTAQVAAVSRADELLALGVPDRRAPRLAELIRAVVRADGGPEHLALLDGLDGRLAAIEACGVPYTLVHGDFHPGNVRGTADRHHLIDWGDAVLGHPAIDLLRMCEQLPDPAPLHRAWCDRWRAAAPGCAPERAIELIGPVLALRNAAVYAGFLTAIEPSEWPYHAGDVPYWLGQALG
ncbi:phosphotransferase family protein [Catellatospora bangladeshensis]|uniref:phosphotransferase family protein n=1 Tax=Catellatospora bangladeshensis TaxID=310355 RepID=UPI0019405ABA|nr:aminoglycoside phosphotransferase family protein [Catellatospora bangladeshensis]